MKRKLQSNPSFQSFKRRSLSLSSIDTEEDDDERIPSSQILKSFSLEPTNLQEILVQAGRRQRPLINQPKTVDISPPSVAIHEDGSIEENDCKAHDAMSPALHGPNVIPQHKATGIVFEDGALHFDHTNRFHKERPLRITSIKQALENNNLLDKCQLFSTNDDDAVNDASINSNTSSWSSSLSATQVTIDSGSCSSKANKTSTKQQIQTFLNDEDFLRVHVPGYMKRLERLSKCTCHDQPKLDSEASQYKSIYLTEHSVDAAKAAASSLCQLVSNVVSTSSACENGFAVIRPPGHHAEPGLMGGFCVINNVAVAAAYARHVLGLNKIMIVDWDVHHGNGTQNIFFKDPNVVYFSVHRWEGGNFFPFNSQGGPNHIGKEAGTGFNINVGWSRRGMGDDEYIAVWDHLLLPVIREYKPDLILISAGFDAADGDLGECHVTPDCFGELTTSLLQTANETKKCPVVAALEGGYVRSILGKCVCSVVDALINFSTNSGTNHHDGDTATTVTMSTTNSGIEKADAISMDLSTSNSSTDDNAMPSKSIIPLDAIDPSAAKNIKSTMEAHKDYWKCFQQ